eukprot:symbB.v1.2.030697.t1/scaffold3489.1/size55649/6
MWAKRLLPSSFSRFVKKPNVDDEVHLDGATQTASEIPETFLKETAASRQRAFTPPRRNDASSPSRKAQGDTDQKRAPPTCPRAFKMISFRTPCACLACGDAAQNTLPNFGRSPSEPPKVLPTFGRSPSAASLQRSGSTRSLSPRRPREEVKELIPCDWNSLFTLVGDLGILQSQVLRKLRDEQEEQLLQQGSSQISTASPQSTSSGCGYQAKKEDKEKEIMSSRAASPRRARERSAPPKERSRSVKAEKVDKLEATEKTKKSVRPKSAAPTRDVTRDVQVSKVSSVSTPKAKAKGKAKTKAKDAAIEKAECQKIEAPKDVAPPKPKPPLSHRIMWNTKGDEIPLQNLGTAKKWRICCKSCTLQLRILCVSTFGSGMIFFWSFSAWWHEAFISPRCNVLHPRQHCQERKAGVARRAPKLVNGEERYLTTVRLRVRKHPAKGDPQKEFIGRGTMLAVFLHELAHLRYMNHGQDFMLFLREIFAEATKRKLFSSELVNELPSCRPWENLIYQTGGDIDVESLMKVFEPDSSNCATPRNMSPRARPQEKAGKTISSRTWS